MAKIIKIDTSNNKKIIVALSIDGKEKEISSEASFLKSEACLPMINDLLKENNINITELDSVYVNLGPGSFTGLRVGASIANALGSLLQIPVNNKKIGDLAFPVYNS